MGSRENQGIRRQRIYVRFCLYIQRVDVIDTLDRLKQRIQI